MKRRDLEKHLRQYGCELHHSTGKHDIWVNMMSEAKAPLPRHREIKTQTGRSICRQLGIPAIQAK